LVCAETRILAEHPSTENSIRRIVSDGESR
jgi:hypothetical protein